MKVPSFKKKKREKEIRSVKKFSPDIRSVRDSVLFHTAKPARDRAALVWCIQRCRAALERVLRQR